MKKFRKLGIGFGLIAIAFFIYLNFPEPQTVYQKYIQEKIARKKAGHVKADAPEMMGIIARELRTRNGDSQPNYGPNQVMNEFLKARVRSAKLRTTQTDLKFIERGPGNVAGRTRAFIVDPDDTTGFTWYAGSASGGIWKTTNRGTKWEYLSKDIPNLGTNTLVMAPSNTQVIYAGTGEHFVISIDGAGMFKSTDKGKSWTQVANPSEFNDFKNVSRIIVDPDDENTVIATTRNSIWQGRMEAAIYKTTDGGKTWTRLLSSNIDRYDDIDYDPSNFNTLYVAINRKGVIKSEDGGVTWNDASEGMSPTGRVEITVSPVNTQKIWASVEGPLSQSRFSRSVKSDLYVSEDGAKSWKLVIKNNGAPNEDFLGGQGFYNNIITAHPLDENSVYVGGVNLFKFTLNGKPASIYSLKPDENDPSSFFQLLNSNNLNSQSTHELRDSRPVEIRFGVGSQKAHRFSVNQQGSGVAFTDYKYQDYVDVPFQVWATDTDEQLMVSFRDQKDDGEWNLIEFNVDGDPSDHSREYIFIHNIPYSKKSDFLITAQILSGLFSGVTFKNMYFLWPYLASGASFNKEGLPNLTFSIQIDSAEARGRNTTNISDAYIQLSGINTYQTFDSTKGILGFHPDQHNIVIGNLDTSNQTFKLYIANDGGIYESNIATNPGEMDGDFTFRSFGYNTSQYHGADKAPGEARFIGGTQDNGTWYNSSGTTGSADTRASFGIRGDGFEVLWHSKDVNKIIGTAQFNDFSRTLDGGETWDVATNGYNDESPFFSRLSHHKSKPDIIFTVGRSGVWRSEDFGSSWSRSTMNDPSLWHFSTSTDIEVSYANPDVIWAGTYIALDGRPHLSTDGGITFNAVNNYNRIRNMGNASGLATHPYNEDKAYLLFSFAGFPKVLMTADAGNSWKDISGFDGSGDRGFPDVATNCLFVFPSDTNKIWVGSEIGIVESLDRGASWNLLDSELPYVNVWDFKLSDSTLVIATYGRGIWSVDIPLPPVPIDIPEPTDPDILTAETNKDNIQFFPTVVSSGDMITIRGANPPNKIEIIDLNGQFVKNLKLTHSNSQLSTTGLSQGVYFIKIKNTLLGKFVVRH